MALNVDSLDATRRRVLRLQPFSQRSVPYSAPAVIRRFVLWRFVVLAPPSPPRCSPQQVVECDAGKTFFEAVESSVDVEVSDFEGFHLQTGTVQVRNVAR